MSGHNQEVTNVARDLLEARSKRIEEVNRNWADNANQTTFATNEPEEGLLDAYFGEQIKRQFGIPDGTHTYSFGGANNTNTLARKKSTAKIIFDRVSPVLANSKQHTAIELIVASLVNDSYDGANGDTVTFEIFKTEERVSYQKINNGALGGEAFIVVKGFALKDKESTIEIFERSPFLLMEDEIPLTVIQYDSLEAEEPNEDINRTQLKATFDDNGEAVVKIKFRPKVEDPDAVYQSWLEKFKPKEPISLPPPSAEEMQQITPSVPLTFGSDVSQSESEVSTDPENYPLPSNQKPALPPIINFLYLKVKVIGDKQDYEKEFLNENENAYFNLKEGGCCKIDENHFFDEYDKEFSSQSLSESNKTSLKKMFTAIKEYYGDEKRCCNLQHIAYMLATAKHETADTYNPISEYGGTSYFQGLYDPVLGKNQNRRDMAIRNGNTTQGDGVKYRGRGFVQLTWKNNYQRMGDKFGVDLVNNPDMALEHGLAIKIMIYGSENGTFTGVSLSNYINDTKTDYFTARRVINRLDKAGLIEGYAKKIEKCLKIEECNC